MFKAGFHIHHIDGNHSNDTADNLVLMEGIDHFMMHGVPRPRRHYEARPKTERGLADDTPRPSGITGSQLNAWLDIMGWSGGRAAREIGVHPNTMSVWRRDGAPNWVKLSCQALFQRTKELDFPWE
jgi:hypothetical protein